MPEDSFSAPWEPVHSAAPKQGLSPPGPESPQQHQAPSHPRVTAIPEPPVSQPVTRLLVTELKSALVLLINPNIHTQTPPNKWTAFDCPFSFLSIKVVSFYICPLQHSSTDIHPFIAVAGTCHRSDSPNTIFEELHEVSIPTNFPWLLGEGAGTSLYKPQSIKQNSPFLFSITSITTCSYFFIGFF